MKQPFKYALFILIGIIVGILGTRLYSINIVPPGKTLLPSPEAIQSNTSTFIKYFDYNKGLLVERVLDENRSHDILYKVPIDSKNLTMLKSAEKHKLIELAEIIPPIQKVSVKDKEYLIVYHTAGGGDIAILTDLGKVITNSIILNEFKHGYFLTYIPSDEKEPQAINFLVRSIFGEKVGTAQIDPSTGALVKKDFKD